LHRKASGAQIQLPGEHDNDLDDELESSDEDQLKRSRPSHKGEPDALRDELLDAIQKKDLLRVKNFYSAHASTFPLSKEISKTGGTALHCAVESDSAELVQWLLEQKASMTLRDIINDAPIHAAARGKSNHSPDCFFNALQVLVRFPGADLEIATRTGMTPLKLSVSFDNAACVKLLCESKANVNATSKDGSPILISAIGAYGEEPEYMIVNISILQNLLDAKASLTQTWLQNGNSQTLLDTIASHYCPEAVRSLVFRAMLAAGLDIYGNVGAARGSVSRFQNAQYRPACDPPPGAACLPSSSGQLVSQVSVYRDFYGAVILNPEALSPSEYIGRHRQGKEPALSCASVCDYWSDSKARESKGVVCPCIENCRPCFANCRAACRSANPLNYFTLPTPLREGNPFVKGCRCLYTTTDGDVKTATVAAVHPDITGSLLTLRFADGTEHQTALDRVSESAPSVKLSVCAADHRSVLASLSAEQLAAKYTKGCVELWGPKGHSGPRGEVSLQELLMTEEYKDCQSCGSDGTQFFSFCLNRAVCSKIVRHCDFCGQCYYYRGEVAVTRCPHCLLMEAELDRTEDPRKKLNPKNPTSIRFLRGLANEGYWGM
jgi:ankyrin repeat protein